MIKLFHGICRFIPHKHKFYHKKNAHGSDLSKRYCRWCGYSEWLFYDLVTYIPHWEESPYETARKIKGF